MVEEEFDWDFSTFNVRETYHSLQPSIYWFMKEKLGLSSEKDLSLVLKDLQKMYDLLEQHFLFVKSNPLFSGYREYENDLSIVFSRFAYFQEHFSSYLRRQSQHDLKIIDRSLRTIFLLMKESHVKHIVNCTEVHPLVLANFQIVLSRLRRVIASFAVVSKS